MASLKDVAKLTGVPLMTLELWFVNAITSW